MGKIKGIEVKLAIGDDLKNSIAVLNAETDKVLKAVSDAEKIVLALRSVNSNGSKVQSTQGKFTTVAENLAKDLGINPSAVPGYSEALKAYASLDSALEKTKMFE